MLITSRTTLTLPTTTMVLISSTLKPPAGAASSRSFGQLLSRPILHNEIIDDIAKISTIVGAGLKVRNSMERVMNWQKVRYTGDIMAHSLYNN
jgi:hypothetical protein